MKGCAPQSLLKHKSEMNDIFLDTEVEESVDPFNDVLLTTWQPSGLQRFFMAPRRLRMRRLWRSASYSKDTDHLASLNFSTRGEMQRGAVQRHMSRGLTEVSPTLSVPAAKK